MSARITLRAKDGHVFQADRSDPATEPKGGVIILHAISGLTPHIGDVCDQWAAAGYSVIAPSLFDRIAPNLTFAHDASGSAAGREAYAKLTEDGVFNEIDACIAALDSDLPKVISGFCTGGTWAWIAAAKRDFDAQVNFYGSHVVSKLDFSPRCPTVMHYGDADYVVPVADIKKISNAHPDIEIHVYAGAGHAFFNPIQRYDPEAAQRSWQKSMEFLTKNLNT